MKKREVVKSNILFNQIINEGNKVSNKYFHLFYLKNNDLIPHYGIAVGKKMGNAVARNKIKRQIRHMIDNHKIIFSNANNYIIMVKKAYLDLSFSELEENLVELFRKVTNEK